MSEGLTSLYDFELPDHLIAQRPLVDRAGSRLLVLKRESGAVTHRTFRDLPALLEPADLLVLNSTRVSARRIHGRRPTGGAVELLVMSLDGDTGVVLARPANRLRVGSTVLLGNGLEAHIDEDLGGGRRRVTFRGVADVEAALSILGEVPLPPYVRERLDDPERYQTVYASEPGSAAAPTAGLHFDRALLSDLDARGVTCAHVTLDVGLDTFRPVSVEKLDEHLMHGERFAIPEATSTAIAACRGRVVAVGTTTVRALESASKGRREVEPGPGRTSMFIRPGYTFQTVDAMLTNFHLPRTTMLAMVSALCGREHLLAAYGEAVRERYRFLSFGDAMLVSS